MIFDQARAKLNYNRAKIERNTKQRDMKKEIGAELRGVVTNLEHARETLFECSHKHVTLDEDEWHVAESLFRLAKSADMLRRQVISILNGTPPSTAMMDTSTSEKSFVQKEKPATHKPSKKRKEDYPKYLVRNESLVKIGLGRDRRTEYEQVVPKSEFDKILDRLNALIDTEEFTAEDVQQELECPMYQTYIVLALLREMELLELPRRGVYSFPSAETFTSNAHSIWSQLQQAQ